MCLFTKFHVKPEQPISNGREGMLAKKLCSIFIHILIKPNHIPLLADLTE